MWQIIGEECKNLIPKKRELTTWYCGIFLSIIASKKRELWIIFFNNFHEEDELFGDKLWDFFFNNCHEEEGIIYLILGIFFPPITN